MTIASGDSAETVRDNRSTRRFEIAVDRHTAFLQYNLKPGEITLVHTEVPPSSRGRGLGNVLARAALEAARRGGLRVRALCPFVRAYVRKHPEFRSLLGEVNPETTGPPGRA